MNNNLFRKSKLLTLGMSSLVLLLSACIEKPQNDQEDPLSPLMVEQNVVLVSGVDYETGRLFAYDPISAETIMACNSISTDAKRKQQMSKQECLINDYEIRAPESVLDAIKTSQETIDGSVIKDGKEIPARFVVTVSALYEGSLCVTEWSGGAQYENCTNVKQKCNFYVKFKSRITPAITKTCNQFPGWPNTLIP